MPRKSDTDQVIKAYKLFSEQRLGTSAITRRLEEEFAAPLGERQVRRYVRKWEAQREEESIPLDEPFQWQRLEDYGLPWESGRLLLQVWRHNRRYERILPGFPPFTVRQARWAWRVHQAAPSIYRPEDVLGVSRAFALRELRHAVLGETLDLTDLEGWLSHRPWEGGSDDDRRVVAYLLDIEWGIMPALRLSNDADFNVSARAVKEKGGDFIAAVLASSWPEEEETDSGTLPRWFLPSQLRRAKRNDPDTEEDDD